MNPIIKSILERTADLIEFHGWTQGKYRDRTGAICLKEGLHRAASELHVVEHGAWCALEQYLDSNPVEWQDEPSRRREEVLVALRECAKNV